MLGSGIASLDATVVNIALPTIGRDFHEHQPRRVPRPTGAPAPEECLHCGLDHCGLDAPPLSTVAGQPVRE